MSIDAYGRIFNHKQRILGVFSHPGDAEIYAGGTLARLTGDGYQVRLLKLTSGNRGSRQERISSGELQLLREQEDRQAAKILGIAADNNFYLHIPDGEVENSLSTINAIALEIRCFKPDLVITHNPEHVVIRFGPDTNWVNHRDHRNTGLSTLDAVYPYSRDLLFFPEHQLKDPKAITHTVTELLLVDYYDHPDTIAIDVGKTQDIRTKAIAAHSSQYSLEKAQASTSLFTNYQGGCFERFRYVVAD